MKITKILKIDPDKLEIKAEFQKDDGTKEKRNVQIKEFRKKAQGKPLAPDRNSKRDLPDCQAQKRHDQLAQH
jgi:hypothetical protein